MTGNANLLQCLPRPYQGPGEGAGPAALTLFCDFDGPIMDVSERYYSAYQLGLAETQAIYQRQGQHLRLQLLTKKQFWQMKQDRVPDPEIALRSGLYQEQISVFLEQVGQIVNQPALLQQDRLQAGVHFALSSLRAHNVRLVLVTLRCQVQALQILRQHGLDHLFSYVCGTHDNQAAYHNYTEVKVQLLRDVLVELSTPEVRTHPLWMVGDTEADVLSGQALGISTLALTCGIRSRLYLQKLMPTSILSNLPAAAHYLIDSLSCVGAK